MRLRHARTRYRPRHGRPKLFLAVPRGALVLVLVTGLAVAADLARGHPAPVADAAVTPRPAPPRTLLAREPHAVTRFPLQSSPARVSTHTAAVHPLATVSAVRSATQTHPAPAPSVTPTAVPSPARSSVSAASGWLGGRLLAMAEAMTGVPYVWAGAGPGGFDCSGLVYWAAGRLGISLPRTTYGMLGAVGGPHLVRVYSPRQGDLAFFGSGHVELYVQPGQTFGAQKPGTLVGFHSYGYGYVPTEFVRLV